jgi:hypothetical protein
MSRTLIILFIALALGVLSPEIRAQTPPPANAAAITAPPPIPDTPSSSSGVLPEVESLIQHKAWHTDLVRQPAGFRNPGGAGRTNEFMPADNQFQNPGRARPAANYRGGIPDRAEQIAAYNAGTARYSAIQNHIDNYGRPMMGFGMGFGFR